MKKVTKREKSLSKVSNTVLSDRAFRINLAKQSHKWFFATYFSEHIKYGIAPFQEELFELTEDDEIPLVVIEAFRGCGKTTIMVLSYILWAVLGKQKKKHILLASQSSDKAIGILRNIKIILETNKQLISDFGPFRIPPEPWKENSLHLPKYDAKIVPISLEISPRGFIHKSIRPDLIIIDDLESINNINSVEIRDKTYKWFTEEVIPCGDRGTKIVVTGNYLHPDSLIKRLQIMIEEDQLYGVYKRYPFLALDGKPLWKSKFPTDEDVDRLRKTVGDKNSWLREYLLKEIAIGTSPFPKQLVKYYDDLPTEDIKQEIKFQYVGTGVDLAISKESTADYTTMVSAKVFWVGSKVHVYILPNPINLRLSFPEAFELVKKVSKSLDPKGIPTEIVVETVAYQQAMEDMLKGEKYPVIGIKHGSLGKRERLSLIANFVAHGNVYFPRKGAELLITQLVGFGGERHDDLADAFVMILDRIKSRCNLRPYEWNYVRKPPEPVYRNIMGEWIDMSEPITKGLWNNPPW